MSLSSKPRPKMKVFDFGFEKLALEWAAKIEQKRPGLELVVEGAENEEQDGNSEAPPDPPRLSAGGSLKDEVDIATRPPLAAPTATRPSIREQLSATSTSPPE